MNSKTELKRHLIGKLALITYSAVKNNAYTNIEAKDATGKKITLRYLSDNKLIPGSPVSMVMPDKSEQPAQNGTYTLTDGKALIIADGVIKSMQAGKPKPATVLRKFATDEGYKSVSVKNSVGLVGSLKYKGDQIIAGMNVLWSDPSRSDPAPAPSDSYIGDKEIYKVKDGILIDIAPKTAPKTAKPKEKMTVRQANRKVSQADIEAFRKEHRL